MATNEASALLAAGAVACVVLLAIVMVVRCRKAAARGTGQTPARESAADMAPMVLVRTHDGTLYQGKLDRDVESSAEHPVVVLAGPIVFRRAGGETESMAPSWDRLALPRQDVAELWTRSGRATSPAAAADSESEAPHDDTSAPVIDGDAGDDAGPAMERHEARAPESRGGARRRRARVTAPSA